MLSRKVINFQLLLRLVLELMSECFSFYSLRTSSPFMAKIAVWKPQTIPATANTL